MFAGQCGNTYLFSIVRHIKYNIYEVSDFKNTILDDRFCLFRHRRELLNQVWPSPNIKHIELFRMLIFFFQHWKIRPSSWPVLGKFALLLSHTTSSAIFISACEQLRNDWNYTQQNIESWRFQSKKIGGCWALQVFPLCVKLRTWILMSSVYNPTIVLGLPDVIILD